MKVDLSSLDSNESFMVHAHEIANERVFLVQPRVMVAEWTKDNMHFRSSVWSATGELVSASFPKFFNWGEKPELSPVPTSLKGASLMEKVDGSTLIFSRYKGVTVARTRGTVDARTQLNGEEVDLLLKKYPKFTTYLQLDQTSPRSYLFEWVTPSNRIVLDYGPEPDMIFIGVVNHRDYSLYTQTDLDDWATVLGLRRPRRFSYDSVEEMRASVEAFRGQEGLCVYFQNDQRIVKVKGAHYLYLHRAKSELSSIEKVMDVFLDNMFASSPPVEPTFASFTAYLESVYDYELSVMAMPSVSKICDAMKEVNRIKSAMEAFSARVISDKLTPKDAAGRVLQAYGDTGRSSMVFNTIKNKPFELKDYKKLLFQCLKK